jgi:Na+-translocating ferredoxin:NAD+ oxidoreductase RnfC subunit
VGIAQTAGRPLKSIISEDDEVTWQQSLFDPAHHAAIVIAMAGDPVAKAVAAHPEGLKELEVLCTTGQPCAKIYRSEVWTPQTTH